MDKIYKIILILLSVVLFGAVLRLFAFPALEGFRTKRSKTKKKVSRKKKGTVAKVNGPEVDLDKNMKNFLNEHADNEELMGSLHKDAKALMKNQKQLMDMLQTTGPMLKSSMDMVKSFKGMFGDTQ